MNRSFTNHRDRVRYLRRLKWSAVIVPATFTLWSETMRHRFFEDIPTPLGNFATAALAFLSAYLFAQVIFHYIKRIDADLLAQNRRLATLHALSVVTNQPGDEATLLAMSLPIVRGALGVERVIFDTGSGQPSSEHREQRYVLHHDGITLGALVLSGIPEVFDVALLASIGDTLTVALANRRLVAQNAHLAVLEERDRIARELHDGLAQMLAAITFQSEHARASLVNGNTRAARVAVDRIEEASTSAYEDVREAIVGLRTGMDTNFLPALQQTIERFEDTTGITTALSGVLSAESLSSIAELQLLRVVQECLTNVRKHAGATAVDVRIAEDTAGVRLVIHDNGAGFDPDHLSHGGRQHFGLLIMRERVQSFHGHLSVQSATGSGTTISVSIPVCAVETQGVA